MLFVLVCTEGKVSEPECIKAFLSIMPSQIPQAGEEYVDVVPVPLNGNHGYKILIEKAEEQIEILENDEESMLFLAQDLDDGSEKEKWLVCDYDQLDSSGITYEEFERSVKDAGYTLIMNKPNFEYFILAVLSDWKTADSTSKSKYEDKINSLIDKLNESNKVEKHFTDAQKIPYYSKKLHVAEKSFGMLFQYN